MASVRHHQTVARHSIQFPWSGSDLGMSLWPYLGYGMYIHGPSCKAHRENEQELCVPEIGNGVCGDCSSAISRRGGKQGCHPGGNEPIPDPSRSSKNSIAMKFQVLGIDSPYNIPKNARDAALVLGILCSLRTHNKWSTHEVNLFMVHG